MAQEIERKFRVANDDWRAMATSSSSLKQGYLSSSAEATVRVRLEDNHGTLTIKSKTKGITRNEFEYAIPAQEAKELLMLCKGPLIEKIRFRILQENHMWEIDVFEGDNDGLIIAEIELTSEDDYFAKPQWLGEEVSGDSRYYNSNLATHPYVKW
ncbi:MAG: CYTH domain-containing protein [Bacteroidetes bacterium]|nr:CYTH domain-containing protein [Bacteroidota bacterium]